MCRNQLGRRNITDEQKTALIGEAYKAQKMSYGASDGFRGNQHIQKVSAQNEHLAKGRTSEVIAKYFGVGKETVKRAEQFLDGLNEAEKVSPGIKETVLSGSIKAPKSVISEIRNAPEEKKREAVEAIKKGDTDTARHKNPFIFCRIFKRLFFCSGYSGNLKGGVPLSAIPLRCPLVFLYALASVTLCKALCAPGISPPH